MSDDTQQSELFSPGAAIDAAPVGEIERQAVDALRGYAYQLAASAAAWLDLSETGRLYLEVAEDYATVAGEAIHAVQVKDTAGSGSVTLQTTSVCHAIDSYVDLVERNAGHEIELRYFTTSPIGLERSASDRPGGEAGLAYWRRAATLADVAPLRSILTSESYSDRVREFVHKRDDAALRADLLQKVHWDCGKPDIAGIRCELEERLIVIGRDRFQLASPEARRLIDILMHHVLKKSIVKNSAERVLTRAELYSIIDAATRVSISRSELAATTRLASTLAGGFVEAGGNLTLAAGDFAWLINGADLPSARGIISRPHVEDAIVRAIRTHRAALLVGSTGLGKSLLARSVATRIGDFTIADLRGAGTTESLHRLDLLLGRIGALKGKTVFVEDCDNFDSPGTSLSLGCVLTALQRRDKVCLLTSHHRPSPRMLMELGLDATAVIDIPYFTEDETKAVVQLMGGDPQAWGRLAFLAGASGHPQLVHAFATGMAARGWPSDSMVEVVIGGFTSDDVDAERDAVRRSLTTVLSADALNLLYRLSLAIGHFDRALALDIANLPPAIARAGEHLDEMVGPWIEALGHGLYRMSPLAVKAGQAMFTADEQRRIHAFIAERLLASRQIDASDAGAILVHSLAGKSGWSLTTLAYGVIMADAKELKLLSEHFVVLRILRTDVLIYPENPLVSALLRLAQFKLVAETRKGADILACVTALMRDGSVETNAEARRAFEAITLTTVLMVVGIGDYLPTWIDLLVRYKNMVESDSYLQELKTNFESSQVIESVNAYGMLFSIGAFGISTVRRLEEVIDELNSLEPRIRDLFLQAYERRPNDYSSFVNGPWGVEHTQNAINSADAAERYRRMAQRTAVWGTRALAIRCHVARSIMLEEYGNDKEAGLHALEEGLAALGDDIVFARARAKILWRHDDHAGALTIFRNIADGFGRDAPVERAFAMREAAICAANTDNWPQAEIWFAEGQIAALAAPTEDMKAMAIGLCADAAVAAFEAGKTDRALIKLKESVTGLRSLDASASLRTAYCHRVVRHTVLWIKAQLEPGETLINGEPIGMRPGTCSNPEPLPAIRELPLADIDVAEYMLAEAEIISGLDVGVNAALPRDLVQGPIIICDLQLQQTRMSSTIERVNAAKFAEHVCRWLEVTKFVHEHRANLAAEFDPMSPPRGEVPHSDSYLFGDAYADGTAIDATFAFCIAAVLAGKADMVAALERDLRAGPGRAFPGLALFNYWNGETSALDQPNAISADAIRNLRAGQHVEPRALWEIGLRLFERGRPSSFKRYLIGAIAAWLRTQWARIIANETFRLVRPRQTVPDIENALANPVNDEPFVAALLINSATAVGAKMAPQLHDLLKSIAESPTESKKASNKPGRQSGAA